MAEAELNLVDALVQSSFLVQGVLRRVAARHELSVVQMRLLGILRDREPGVLALALLLELDKSSVTGLLDRATGRGLVERVADPDDGRAIRVRLTRKGRALATKGAAEVAAEVETISTGLAPAERRRLAALLSGIVVPSAERANRPGGG